MHSKRGGPVLWGCVGLVCLASFIAAAGTSGTPDHYLFTEASHYNPSAWLTNAERFPAGAAIVLVSGGKRHALAPDFAASADPDLSFDATHVLFAGRQKTGDPWRIWEVALEGGMSRQVSSGEDDCYRPLYLPGDQVVWTRRTGAGSEIEIAPLAGGKAERLTFAPGRFLTADVLRDGRVLFEAEREYGGKPAGTGRSRPQCAPSEAGGPLRCAGVYSMLREIMTVYPDGTGVESIRCDHGADRYSPKQVASGDIVFVEHGRLARFTSPLAHETPVTLQPAGEIAGPVADSGNGEFIAATRATAQQPFHIAAWQIPGRSPNRNELQPIIVAPRAVPRRFPSALLAIRTAGNLLCLNVATSRDPIRGAAIRAIRAYTRDADGRPALLGTQAVEKDGSFFIQVPGDRPLRLEAIDAAGHVVSAERNWWWMRVAEQRACVGCHAGPERAPTNAVPQVLLRHDVPVPMLAPVVMQAKKQGS